MARQHQEKKPDLEKATAEAVNKRMLELIEAARKEAIARGLALSTAEILEEGRRRRGGGC